MCSYYTIFTYRLRGQEHDYSENLIILYKPLLMYFLDGDLNTTDTLCKNNLDTCLMNVSVLLDHNGLIGIPKSKDDVDIVCK